MGNNDWQPYATEKGDATGGIFYWLWKKMIGDEEEKKPQPKPQPKPKPESQQEGGGSGATTPTLPPPPKLPPLPGNWSPLLIPRGDKTNREWDAIQEQTTFTTGSPAHRYAEPVYILDAPNLAGRAGIENLLGFAGPATNMLQYERENVAHLNSRKVHYTPPVAPKTTTILHKQKDFVKAEAESIKNRIPVTTITASDDNGIVSNIGAITTDQTGIIHSVLSPGVYEVDRIKDIRNDKGLLNYLGVFTEDEQELINKINEIAQGYFQISKEGILDIQSAYIGGTDAKFQALNRIISIITAGKVHRHTGLPAQTTPSANNATGGDTDAKKKLEDALNDSKKDPKKTATEEELEILDD